MVGVGCVWAGCRVGAEEALWAQSGFRVGVEVLSGREFRMVWGRYGGRGVGKEWVWDGCRVRVGETWKGEGAREEEPGRREASEASPCGEESDGRGRWREVKVKR